uniref:Golgi integral membrane protein 4-like n=1 Tax=Phallusia mammillata TaxID=59560 RepID=A0A6F9DE27_9ASCI|nr:Golgi integral membrane protein 4-like [Phallusia mammillata]
MLHINSSKNSMMFNRRHRGWIQTSVILILIVALGYGVYLYNVLQGKLQLMDIKSQRFQSQQHSLSTQLQVVYEDRSKLESTLQKEKMDHQNTKDELEQNMHSHQSDLEKMDKEHQIKYEELHEKHLLTQNKLEEVNRQLSEHQMRYKDTDQQYQEKIEELKQQIESKSAMEADNNILQAKLDELKRAHNQLQLIHEKLKEDHGINQKEVMKYIKLQSLLNGLGADTLKLDHPNLGKLHSSDRALVFAHFGGDPNNVQAMEDSRERLMQEKQSRSEALEKQRLEKLKRDNEIAARNKIQPTAEPKKSLNDNCFLPKKVGDCENEIERFYYDPRVGSCLKFSFTGCGGNDNNFPSVRECEEYCHIGVRHQQASNEALNAPGQDLSQHNDFNNDDNQKDVMDNDPHLENRNANDNPLRAQQYNKDQHESDDQNNDQPIQGEAIENEDKIVPEEHGDVEARNEDDESRESRFQAEGQIEDADKNNNPNEPKEEINYRDNPEERNSQLDQVESEEDQARAAEKLAQLELDAQQSQNDQEDLKPENGKNAIEKLQQLQKEQQQIIDVQSENIKELVQQNQDVQHKGQVHGEIFEEEAAKLGVDRNRGNEGDGEEADEGEGEDQAQVDVPPAGRPLKQDPQLVGDAPIPAGGQNHGEEDFNDEDQNYNGENDNGDEEQYEDENDENNEGANNGYADESQDRGERENDADSRHREALAHANKLKQREREM